ncbi:MAG: PQQ-binding-like beta-propeller repeat protein [Candidatus Brocadiia bacterium]
MRIDPRLIAGGVVVTLALVWCGCQSPQEEADAEKAGPKASAVEGKSVVEKPGAAAKEAEGGKSVARPEKEIEEGKVTKKDKRSKKAKKAKKARKAKKGTEKAAEVEKAKLVVDPGRMDLDLRDQGLKVIWRQNLGHVGQKTKLGNLYALSDTLVAGTPAGNLFFFDARSGVWNATSRLKGELWEDPAGDKKEVYVITGRGLSVINAESGVVRKRFRLRIPVSCPPVPVGNALLLGGANSKITKLSLESGKHLWSVSPDGSVQASPVVNDEMFYGTGYRGAVIAGDLSNGKIRWRWKPKEPSQLMGGLTMGEGFIYVGDNRGYVYSLLGSDGVAMWKYPLGTPITDLKYVDSGHLVVATHESGITLLSPGDEPSEKWIYKRGKRMLAAGENGYYFLTRNGDLACVNVETGKEKWRLPIVKDYIIAVSGKEPIIFVGCASGEIIAFQEMD